MRSYTAELVHAGKRSHRRVVFNDHMPRESRGIRQNGVISQRAVMADMDVCHQIVMIPDACTAAAALRTPMNVDVFAEYIMISDRKERLLALELQVLRLETDRPEGIKMVLLSNL